MGFLNPPEFHVNPTPPVIDERNVYSGVSTIRRRTLWLSLN